MKVINLSAEPLGKLYSWLPHDLEAEKVVFLPDACPGKAPLPTGTAVFTSQNDWRRFAVSDCGCGMRLLKSRIEPRELDAKTWSALGLKLKQNKRRLGDLGGGNHFLDALEPHSGGPLHFLIHTGSRMESNLVDDLMDEPDRFDREFQRIVLWAEQNREAVQSALEECFDSTEVMLDHSHNSYEQLGDGRVIIRKGSVRVNGGDQLVIPSHISGDVLLAKARHSVSKILNSLSHGTGRSLSRSECKAVADQYDFASMREKIMIPDYIDDASLRSEGPYAYRELDECLSLIGDFVEESERLRVVAYLGHL